MYNAYIKVFRYATKEEVDLILQGRILDVGGYCEKTNCNTHRYKCDTKYLHFFKKISSIEEIKCLKRGKKRTYYICEYDIPMLVLMFGRGVGYYNSKGLYKNLTSHVEYIVPVEYMRTEWLKMYKIDNFEKSNEKEMTF